MRSSGQSIPHDSAWGHVTGTAAYIDDLPKLDGELSVDFVGAPIACGRILSIDTSSARKIPGVVGVYTCQDLPGHNHFGPIFRDEPFLVDSEIAYLGQPVVVVAAISHEVAWEACKAIKIDCEARTPLLSIDDAIAAKSFLGPERMIPNSIEGVFESNGQEQFYFESQACIAIPGEERSMRVLSSTQNPTETQSVVAEALGLKLHQVVCECKRMGGGFGGKETQSAIPAVMASLVAHLTGRSARIVYRKDQDMIVTGKRHAYKTWYRAAFTAEGRILAIDVRFYSNGGAFADLSTSVMERSMLHADNAYFLPAARIVGQVCKLNYPPNTAFRGFGGPQGVAVIENIIQEIALRVDKDAFDVRRLNAYRDGDSNANTTPYGQIVCDHVIAELFDRLETTSEYRRRMAEVIEWNARSKTHVKGLAMSPIKFGISFTTKFLNQGNALVNVYTDGSVQVSSGGTEMGQGLNTKLRQIVADAFGIGSEDVLVMPTSTEKNHNTSPTAASAGTDLNGQAVLLACQAIRERLAGYASTRLAEPNEELSTLPKHVIFEDGNVFDERQPTRRIQFVELCESARRERVDLGARGFYATPGVDFNRETGRGTPFYYFTTGAAVSEVTIDRFTGELIVDRIDVLMDLGEMINPGIDLGQVVGGFVQGMGWCTNEELVYDAAGKLLSTSPTTYKIPNITDIPTAFYVNTLDNPRHRINVLRSKAVGEPPLMLGISVWLAIKHALSQAAGNSPVNLAIPATGEAILKALTDARTRSR
jgi:xanthine dehydrogenase large subunit